MLRCIMMWSMVAILIGQNLKRYIIWIYSAKGHGIEWTYWFCRHLWILVELSLSEWSRRGCPSRVTVLLAQSVIVIHRHTRYKALHLCAHTHNAIGDAGNCNFEVHLSSTSWTLALVQLVFFFDWGRFHRCFDWGRFHRNSDLDLACSDESNFNWESRVTLCGCLGTWACAHVL